MKREGEGRRGERAGEWTSATRAAPVLFSFLIVAFNLHELFVTYFLIELFRNSYDRFLPRIFGFKLIDISEQLSNSS